MISHTETVVVIDDDVEVRTLIELALARPGRAVACFGDGGEAAAFIRSHSRVDCVVSDVRMAGVDGYGLLEQIELDERTRGTHVILVSADDSASDLLTAPDANVEFLRKPFEIADLRARVDGSTGRRKAPARDFRITVADAIEEARESDRTVAVLLVASDAANRDDASLASLTRSCLRTSDIAGKLAPYACAALLTGIEPGRAHDVGRSVAERLRAHDGHAGPNPRVGLAFADDYSHISADDLIDAARNAVSSPEALSAGFAALRANT